MGWTFLPVEDLPEPGDILWCRWPPREKPGVPGQAARPVLVLETSVHQRDDDGVQFGAAVVCYGTGNVEDARPGDFLVPTRAEAASLGLHKPTRFDVGRPKRLIWCEEYFLAPDYLRSRNITIGRLDEAQRLALKALLG